MKCALVISSLLAAFALTSTAAAQDVSQEAVPEVAAEPDVANPGYPMRIAHRPSSLPAQTFRVDVVGALSRAQPREVIDSLALGLGYGITDDVEVGAVVAPLNLGLLDSELAYRDPSLYARYQVLDCATELGFVGSATIPIQEESDPTFLLQVVLGFHQGDLLIETGLGFGAAIGEDTVLRMNLPIELRYSVTERVFFGIETGFAVSDLDIFGDAWAIPLRTVGGLSFGEGAPTADAWLSLKFPQFASASGTTTDAWVMELVTRFFINI